MLIRPALLDFTPRPGWELKNNESTGDCFAAALFRVIKIIKNTPYYPRRGTNLFAFRTYTNTDL